MTWAPSASPAQDIEFEKPAESGSVHTRQMWRYNHNNDLKQA